MENYDLFTNVNLPDQLDGTEEKKLLMLAKEGDIDARNKLLTHNIKLVVRLVTKYFSGGSFDKEELVSIGMFSLIKSIEKFDISRNFRFSTFAWKVIYNDILMYLRSNENKAKKTTNLDAPITVNKDDSVLLYDMLVDPNVNISEDFLRNELILEVQELVEMLPARDKEMVKLYFGFDNGKCYSQREIAQKYGLSRSGVQMTIRRATQDIAKKLEKKGLIYCQGREKGTSKNTKFKTIYEHFNMYPRKLVDDALSELSEAEKEIVFLRYGADLDNPQPCAGWNPEVSVQFYGTVLYRMKRILLGKVPQNNTLEFNAQVTNKVKNNHDERPQQNDASVGNFEISFESHANQVTQADELSLSHVEVSTVMPSVNLYYQTKEAYIELGNNISLLTSDVNNEIFSWLRNSIDLDILQTLSPRDIVIVILTFGYVNEEYFSQEKIAKFLGIEIEDVKETIKNVLSLHRDEFNNFIDDAIDAVSGTQMVMLPKKDVRK